MDATWVDVGTSPGWFEMVEVSGALRDVSPLLGSQTGLNTAEDTMPRVAAKLAELLAV